MIWSFSYNSFVKLSPFITLSIPKDSKYVIKGLRCKCSLKGIICSVLQGLYFLVVFLISSIIIFILTGCIILLSYFSVVPLTLHIPVLQNTSTTRLPFLSK